MWIKSAMSIVPLLLKSNSAAWLPGEGLVPNACSSKSKSIMNVLHILPIRKQDIKSYMFSKNHLAADSGSRDLNIPRAPGMTS